MRPLFSLQGPRRREGRQPRFPEDLVAVGVADPGQIPLRPQEALQLHPGLIEHRGEGFRGERRIQRLYAQAADRLGLLNLLRPPDVQTGTLLWSQLHQPEIFTAVELPRAKPAPPPAAPAVLVHGPPQQRRDVHGDVRRAGEDDAPVLGRQQRDDAAIANQRLRQAAYLIPLASRHDLREDGRQRQAAAPQVGFRRKETREGLLRPARSLPLSRRQALYDFHDLRPADGERPPHVGERPGLPAVIPQRAPPADEFPAGAALVPLPPADGDRPDLAGGPHVGPAAGRAVEALDVDDADGARLLRRPAQPPPPA